VNKYIFTLQPFTIWKY